MSIQGLGRNTLPITGGGGAASGGGVTQWIEQNTLYVGKHGDDTNPGTAIDLAVLTIAQALSIAVTPTTIIVLPGTYSESGLALPTGVYLWSYDRNTTIISGGASAIFTATGGISSEVHNFTLSCNPGVAFATVNASNLRLSRIIATGSASLTGNAGILTIYDSSSIVGRVELLGGDATTVLTIDDTEIVGDSTDLYALYINAANPLIYVKNGCLLQGDTSGAGSSAVYWDTVTNNNLSTKYSAYVHGDITANPFGRSGAQTPTYKSHHCSYNTSPEAGGIWTNSIAVAQRFDTLDPVAVY